MAYKLVSLTGSSQTFGTVTIPAGPTGTTLSDSAASALPSTTLSSLTGAVYGYLVSILYTDDTSTVTHSTALWPSVNHEAKSNTALGNAAGFQQKGSGTVLRTFQAKDQDTLNVRDYGIVGDGVADDTAALQAAINASVTLGMVLRASNVNMRITAKLTIPCRALLDFTGAIITVGATLASGYAISVGGQTAISSGQYPGVVRGLTLVQPLTSGHANPALLVDGISFDQNSGQSSDMAWYDLKVIGFRDGVCFNGPNTYLNYFYNAKIGNCWRRGLATYAATNSGENISFFGGSVFNCVNTSFNAVAVYTDPACVNGWEWNFHGFSLDYCDILAINNAGHLRFTNCHLENNNNNAMIQMVYNASAPRPLLTFIGGLMWGGPGTNSWTSIPTESATGRPAFVTITGGACGVFMEGMQVGTYHSGDFVTEVVQLGTGGSFSTYLVSPIYYSGIAPPNSYGMNSLCVNASSLAGWSQNAASSMTITLDTTTVYAPDTSSRKFVGTGSNTSTLTQTVPITAGKTATAKAYINVTAFTGGSVFARLDFFAQDGVTSLGAFQSSQQYSTVTSGFKFSWVQAVAPPGTAYVRYSNFAFNFVGTAYFSNEHLWIV